MVEARGMLEVCAVDGELVVGVELAFHCVVSVPWIGVGGF